MNFHLVVLTYEAERLGRSRLLEQAMRSSRQALYPASPPMLLNNGGGSLETMAKLFGYSHCQPPKAQLVRTPGAGRNYAVSTLGSSDIGSEDVVVMSDDDMLWNERAGGRLRVFWAEAPDDVVIACGLLEPDYDWNTPRGVIDAFGVKALVRDSAPAAAWSFRWRDREKIFPLSEAPGSEDTDACLKLRQQGYLIVQLDLCTHEGVDVSTHNNRPMGRPLDRAKWEI